MFDQITSWHWGVLGLVLALIELVVPGVLFIWFALGAFIVALLSAVFPMSWQLEAVLFAIIGAAAAVAGRAYIKRHPLASSDPTLNKRGQQYVGRIATLEGPILNGRGRLRVGDSVWSVEGPDMAGGLPVEIVGVNGTTLVVRPAPVSTLAAKN